MLIVVLNDGETFTNLEGCKLALVPDTWDLEQIEDALENEDCLMVDLESRLKSTILK